MMPIKGILAATLLAGLACSPRAPRQPAPAPTYLYLWTGSADSTQPDFLAVLDVTEDSARYGRLVTTLAVPGLRNRPHHTEHEMPADRQLFANGFRSGESFVFDLTRSGASAPRRRSSGTSRATPTRIRSSGCPAATCSRRSRCGMGPPA